MKILAPISALNEFEPLVKSGAEEFYCGVTPPDWLLSMGSAVWMNRRNPRGANLPSLEELEELVSRAHGSSIPVFLTLNAPTYAGNSLPYVVELARVCTEEAGIDAVIASDPGLLLALSELARPPALHLSSLASCFNQEAARFYRDLGVCRIILPRNLKLAEIETLVGAFPEMEFEVFILNDGCWFEEGFCNTTHHLGPFCMTDWQYDFLAAPPGDESERWREHLQDYREFLWYADNCGSSLSPRGLPLGPCGLCALPELKRMGVKSVKIAGREGNLLRKMASVQLVSAVVKRVRACEPPEAIRRYAVGVRRTPDKCASGYMCYYREVAAQASLRRSSAP